MPESAHLQIGALSRRVGVSPELLRAWEQRYGLLQPGRSAGGFRLYSTSDEDRVRLMQRHLDAGVSAAQAARLALTEAAPGGGEVAQSVELTRLSTELVTALDRFDEPGAPFATSTLKFCHHACHDTYWASTLLDNWPVAGKQLSPQLSQYGMLFL